MEGPKRLPFTTLGPPEKAAKKSAIPKTHRFELTIPDSSDAESPEFFYTELIKTIPGAEDKSKLNQSNSADPFGDDDPEKLAAIAKAFEEKYNKPGEGKKKNKKKWHDDYYLEALGEGYDENDSFIDNSEAYDEVLPETHTTKLGGFYINSGQLELKQMSDSEDEFRSPLPVKNKKKRRISSDEDSQDGPKEVKKKKIKDTLSVDGEAKPKKKKKIIPPGEKGFKKPKLKEKAKDGKSSDVSALIQSTPPKVNGEYQQNGINGNEAEKNSMKSNISLVIDSVVAMAANDSDSQSNFEESTPKQVVDPESIPKLPPNLPAGLEEKIEQLKAFAQKSGEGKCKFFSDEVNKLLLEVELLSKQMTVSNRSTMFGHLAAYLPCSKDTLLKRAKTLRVKELEDKIKGPLEKLKQAVNRMMPALKEKFDEECKKAAQEKQEEANKEETKEEKEKEAGREDAGTESEDEEKTNQSDATKKRQTGPRKKFVWDSEIRVLLCDVVRIKMQTYAMSKGKSQTVEEFCKSFLEQDIRPIWPKGWMQTRVLYKESREAHAQWTNPPKPKQQQTLIKKVQGISGAVTVSKTPTSSSVSTPYSGKILSNSDPRNTSSGLKTISVSLSGSGAPVTGGQTSATPIPPPKKVVPTILDYASNTGSSFSGSRSLVMNTPKAEGSLPSPSVINLSETKSESSSKQRESSWNHKISDILRATIEDHLAGKSPPKPVAQRQNSSPATSPSDGSDYMSQFAKFLSGVDSTGLAKQISPPNKYHESHSLMHEQQKKLQQTVEAERQKQIKLLQKQKEARQASAFKSGYSLQQHMGGGDQMKLPNQSPMSLAMSKNIPAGDGGTRKQQASHFPSGSSQKNLMDTFIRQQLNDNSHGSPDLQVTKVSHKTPKSESRGPYVHVPQTTGEVLRKSSPQTQAVKITHNSSPQSGLAKSQHAQGKTGSPHVITLQRSQGHGMHNPAASAMTTSGQQASNLLKTFVGQAQSQTGSGSLLGLNSQGNMSSLTGSSTSTQQHHFSTMSVQELQEKLRNAAGLAIKKPYTMTVSSSGQIPGQVPGYQSVKLHKMSPEQIHAYAVQQQQQQKQQQQQLQAAAGSSLYTKQMSSQGSQNSSQSAALQHYNSMQHYGYHGYGDGNK